MNSRYIFWWTFLTLSLAFCNCREPSEEILELEIDLSKVVAKVDPKFLSVAIGSRLVAENWKNFWYWKLNYPKVSKSRKQILKFSFEPKTNKNFFVFLPYLSKMGQIKKTNANANYYIR